MLHGPTGSGKTEVYLRALAACVAVGKRGMLLAPEISLTPQLVARLQSRFPGRVGLLHSGLTAGQHYDTWWRVREGDYDVVLGTRSAVFAPMPDLGLIILDEEHEWTYKQAEMAPRYHARATAMTLGRLTGATVALGSATPDIATYYVAGRGRLGLLSLHDRLRPGDDGVPTTCSPRGCGGGRHAGGAEGRRAQHLQSRLDRTPSPTRCSGGSRPSSSSTAAAPPAPCSAGAAGTCCSAEAALRR